jgi:hypothetical protein
MPPKDRRAAPGAKGAVASLRHLKGLMVRPLALERREGRLQLVLIERRRASRPEQPAWLVELGAELRERLVAHDDAAAVMRHLLFVFGELRHQGWPGVAILPAPLLTKALVQAEMLASDGMTPPLADFIARLRQLQEAAERHSGRDRHARESAPGPDLVVSEATPEEFEAMTRGWVDTVPPRLALIDGDA